MMNAMEVAKFYETAPRVVADAVAAPNSFVRLMTSAKHQAVEAYDALAYLAGIKAAAPEDHYQGLDTRSVATLLDSARRAGYDAQVVEL